MSDPLMREVTDAEGGTETPEPGETRPPTPSAAATEGSTWNIAAPAPTSDPPAGVRVVELPLSSIVPNPHQPRRQFDEASLNELASSLKTTGLIQPIVVRPAGDASPDGTYQLIAGERRWRAAKLAELQTVPSIVRDVDGATQAQMALIENIQREDLNPVDRALAYRALLNHLGLTQAELAGRLGEDRSTVTNFLRLLDLTPTVQGFVYEGKLSLGHAKLLAGVADHAEQERLASLTVSQSLTVRNLERLIELGPSVSSDRASDAKDDTGKKASAHLQDLERSLSRQLSMRVQVKASARKGHGKLILHYNSLDQFDDLMGKLGVRVE